MGKYLDFGVSFDRLYRNALNFFKDDVDIRIDDQKKRVDDLIKGTPQPSEVVDARGGMPVLRDRLDNVDALLAQRGEETHSLIQKTALSRDRFLSYLNVPSQENPLYIIGDSITEGSSTNDFSKEGYASIIRKAIQSEFNTKNHGFVSFRDLTPYGITQYHKMTYSGFVIDFNSQYYGGIGASSVNAGHWIEVEFIGKDAKLMYAGRADGGVLSVSLDGVDVGSIDTKVIGNVANATISVPITASNWGKHTIRFTKVDNNQTILCGIIYYEDANVVAPIVNNVGRSSITASEIPNDILDVYTSSGTAILALGVNDEDLLTDISLFETKIRYVCERIKTVNGSLIICDFMFSLPRENPYKIVLRKVASEYLEFSFLDFGELWFQNTADNQFAGLLDADGVHPTVDGHKFIADTILKYLGLPYTKSSLERIPNVDTTRKTITLENGWGNFGLEGIHAQAKQYKDKEGKVHLEGLLKGGSTVAWSVIGRVEPGYEPKEDVFFNVACGTGQGEITITREGEIQIVKGSNDRLSLNGVYYRID